MGIIGTVYEGTWEQISRHSAEFAGKQLRVEVVDTQSAASQYAAHDASVQEARAQAILDWGYGHSRRDALPLSDEAIGRESIYAPDGG